MKILISSPAFCQPGLKIIVDYLKEHVDEVVVNPYGRTLKREELLELWKDVDGIIAGVENYSGEVLAQAPKSLKVITRYGAGYDAIDIKAAAQLNIKVSNTPGVNASAVADLTIGLMISIARRIPQYDARTRKGEWSRYVGFGLNDSVLGIIGFGAIGKKVAQRAQGFSMKILAYDPYFDEETAQSMGVQKATIDEIFKNSDFVTLHVPVMKETEKMINGESLKKMKKTAFLINAARGELVDEEALYSALKNNDIQGAALDVFQKEPLLESPLFALDNIVVTPHLAGHTKESEYLMGKMSADNTLQILKQGTCDYIVNKDYL